MPIGLGVVGFAAAATLILAGIALITNWRSWADRYAGWYKSSFGFLAFGMSPSGMRALGFMWIVIGTIIFVVVVMQLAAPHNAA